MKVRRTFPIQITGTGVKMNNAGAYESFLKNLPPGNYQLIIQSETNRRTLPQNAYLHVLFEIIARETGHTAAEVKDSLKREFLTVERANVLTGEMQKEVLNTSGLDTIELAGFIDSIKLFSAEYLGLILPDAGQAVEIDDYLKSK